MFLFPGRSLDTRAGRWPRDPDSEDPSPASMSARRIRTWRSGAPGSEASPPPATWPTSGGSGWSRSTTRWLIWSRRTKPRGQGSADPGPRALSAESKPSWDLSAESTNAPALRETQMASGEREIIPRRFIPFQTILSFRQSYQDSDGVRVLQCVTLGSEVSGSGHYWHKHLRPPSLLTSPSSILTNIAILHLLHDTLYWHLHPPPPHSSKQLECSLWTRLMTGLDEVLSRRYYGLFSVICPQICVSILRKLQDTLGPRAVTFVVTRSGNNKCHTVDV